MDPFKLLKEDHKDFKAMLSEMEESTDRATKKRQQMFEEFKKKVTAHEAIEEEILYPALEARAKDKDLVLEAYQEHHLADLQVEELTDIDVSDETWAPRVKVLRESLEHHIEEEEGALFKAVRAAFDADEIEEFGDQMQERKLELLGETATP